MFRSNSHVSFDDDFEKNLRHASSTSATTNSSPPVSDSFEDDNCALAWHAAFMAQRLQDQTPFNSPERSAHSPYASVDFGEDYPEEELKEDPEVAALTSALTSASAFQDMSQSSTISRPGTTPSFQFSKQEAPSVGVSATRAIDAFNRMASKRNHVKISEMALDEVEDTDQAAAEVLELGHRQKRR